MKCCNVHPGFQNHATIAQATRNSLIWSRTVYCWMLCLFFFRQANRKIILNHVKTNQNLAALPQYSFRYVIKLNVQISTTKIRHSILECKYASKRVQIYMRYWPSLFGQDGWIPAKFSVHKNSKKELGQYLAILTEQAWSIKGLLYGQKITPRLREQSRQSRASKIGPACPLR